MISKLLQPKTTATIFLPISCTSPFTVAINTFPADVDFPDFSASIKGNKYATAFFMTRADFTTCGKNIFPLPNKSPTTFIPAIKFTSITSIAFAEFTLASSTSISINSSIPFTNECVSFS